MNSYCVFPNPERLNNLLWLNALRIGNKIFNSVYAVLLLGNNPVGCNIVYLNNKVIYSKTKHTKRGRYLENVAILYSWIPSLLILVGKLVV